MPAAAARHLLRRHFRERNMRDLEEKEVIEVSGGACEPTVSCAVTCSGGKCDVKCEVKVVCTF